MTRGVDEGDRALDALVLGPDLVRTDVLRDAAGLARDHVGLADGVEQSGLTVVDVTHDGHDGRTDLEVFLVLVLELGVEVETEALEELLVFVLGRDHLDLVAELGSEDLEGRLVERFGRGRHLTQVEQDGDERAGLHRVAGDVLDLVREVRDGCATAHADDLAVAARDVDATDGRRIPHLELLALRPAGLPLLGLAAALAERTGRAAAGATPTTAATTGTTREATACGGSTGRAAGTLEAATGTAGTTGAAGTLLERRSTGTTGTAGTTRATGTRAGRARTRGAGSRRLRARDVARAGARALAHALCAGEGVVARTRTGGPLAHALRARERVVAGSRSARRTTRTRRTRSGCVARGLCRRSRSCRSGSGGSGCLGCGCRRSRRRSSCLSRSGGGGGRRRGGRSRRRRARRTRTCGTRACGTAGRGARGRRGGRGRCSLACAVCLEGSAQLASHGGLDR